MTVNDGWFSDDLYPQQKCTKVTIPKRVSFSVREKKLSCGYVSLCAKPKTEKQASNKMEQMCFRNVLQAIGYQ